MEQVSFIPKSKLTKPTHKAKGPGILILSTSLILFISVLLLGGSFMYEKMLQNRIDVLAESMKRARASFEPTFIEQLDQTARYITAGKSLLDQHRVITPVFDFLEERTLENVSLSSFEYNSGSGKNPTLSLVGKAKSYTSLALQVESFQDGSELISVVTTGLTLGQGGSVDFGANLVFKSEFLKY